MLVILFISVFDYTYFCFKSVFEYLPHSLPWPYFHIYIGLYSNIDIFSWTYSDMTGISPMHASHKLNVIPSARPVRQRVRLFHPNRHQIIQAEIDNLLDAGFIREVKYPEWLANVVVVPKKGGKWRVFVDYTDLKEACPKDSFPSPRID